MSQDQRDESEDLDPREEDALSAAVQALSTAEEFLLVTYRRDSDGVEHTIVTSNWIAKQYFLEYLKGRIGLEMKRATGEIEDSDGNET